MADPTERELASINKILRDQSDTLRTLQQQSQQLFERDYPRYLRRTEDELSRYNREVQDKLQKQMNSMFTRTLGKMAGGLRPEEALALRKLATEHAQAYAQSFGDILKGAFSGNLTRTLTEIAAVALPLNRLNEVFVQNNRIIAEVSSSYGNLFPDAITKTRKASANLTLEYENVARKFRQSREDVDATRMALARNTVGTQEAMLSTTRMVAVLSRLHDIPIAEVTQQMVQATKDLNVQIKDVPLIYADIYSYAQKAAIGTQFLTATSLALAVSLKRQGGELDNYGRFLASSVEGMKKFGVSERQAIEAAQEGIRGISGASQGMSMLVAPRFLQGLQRSMAMGQKLSPEVEKAISQAGYLATGQEGLTTQQALGAIQGNPLAQSFLARLAGGTMEFQRAMVEQVQGMVGSRNLALQAQFAQRQFGLSPDAWIAAVQGQAGMGKMVPDKEAARRAGNLDELSKAAKDLRDQQTTVAEKVEAWAKAVSHNTFALGLLTAVMAPISIAQGVRGLKQIVTRAKGLGALMREGGGLAGTELASEEVAQAGNAGIAAGVESEAGRMSRFRQVMTGTTLKAPVSLASRGLGVLGGIGTLYAMNQYSGDLGSMSAGGVQGAVWGGLAGGALSGFQIAGPVGAAVGALATEITLARKPVQDMIKEHEAWNRALDKFRTQVEGVADSIQQAKFQKATGVDLASIDPNTQLQVRAVYAQMHAAAMKGQLSQTGSLSYLLEHRKELFPTLKADDIIRAFDILAKRTGGQTGQAGTVTLNDPRTEQSVTITVGKPYAALASATQAAPELGTSVSLAFSNR
jgi:hypothetical protein